MLEKIEYKSECSGITTKRDIKTICGLPFYKSSGTASSAPGTWFPFHGFSDKKKEIEEGVLPIGWLIKEAEGNSPGEPFCLKM